MYVLTYFPCSQYSWLLDSDWSTSIFVILSGKKKMVNGIPTGRKHHNHIPFNRPEFYITLLKASVLTYSSVSESQINMTFSFVFFMHTLQLLDE